VVVGHVTRRSGCIRPHLLAMAHVHTTMVQLSRSCAMYVHTMVYVHTVVYVHAMVYVHTMVYVHGTWDIR